MEEIKLAMLLNIIKSEGSIQRLVREGFTYKEIAQISEIAVEKGLLEFNGEHILVTALGHLIIQKYPQLIRINKEKWIDQETESKISKLDKNSLFLPRQDELNF